MLLLSVAVVVVPASVSCCAFVLSLTTLSCVDQVKHGVSETVSPPDTTVPEEARRRLLIHRLPRATLRKDVLALLPDEDAVVGIIDGSAVPRDQNPEGDLPDDATDMEVRWQLSASGIWQLLWAPALVFVCRVLGLEREWMTKNYFMLTYTENT